METNKLVFLNGIRELFAESCAELFKSLDCDIAHCGLVEDQIQGAPTAVIDAGSEDIEFILVIRMPYSVLAMTYPVMGRHISDITEEQLDDWLSELANLLMGRIKAKLIKHHCQVMLGLPVPYFGDEIDVTSINEGFERFDFPFEVDHELCECLLDVRIFNDDLEFIVEEDQEVDVIEEGGIELF